MEVEATRARIICAFSRFSPLKSGLSPALSVYKKNHMQTEELYCFKLPY